MKNKLNKFVNNKTMLATIVGICFAMHSWSLDRINCNLAHLSDNCVIACVDCNRQRKDTLMETFYRRKALIRWFKTHPSIYLIDEENKETFY